MKIEVIIFDFDGVIAESVNVKTEAFRELFMDHPEIVDDVERYHLENGGMSRYDKFRYIYANMLKTELSKEKFRELCDAFHELVIDKVVKSPYVKGAKELLDMCKERYPMYIVSGTPIEEMLEVVERRNLAGYFKGVYGSPDSKTDIINRIITEKGYERDEVLFIGDSRNDLIAAEETGILFFAREEDPEKEWIKSSAVKMVVPDMRDVIEYLNRES